MELQYTFHPNLVLRAPSQNILMKTEGIDMPFFWDNRYFLEALYLASPVLYEELMKYKNGKVVNEKEVRKLTYAVLKYFMRMSTRCTPFGLFSGCAVLEWHDNFSKIVIDTNIIERNTRFDMHYLCALSQHLASLPKIKERLLYYPNTSYYRVGDEIRYVEYTYVEAKRNHQISAVKYSKYLEKIFLMSEKGVYITELVSALIGDEIEEEEAESFINELIDAQLLVTALEPAITGDEFLDQIIKELDKINYDSNFEIEKVINDLKHIDEQLKKIDANGINNILVYKEVINYIKNFDIAYDESKLFQTDMSLHLKEAKINISIQKNIISSLEILNKITRMKRDSKLLSFAKRFYERYEDKEMPLLEVLDTEMGIGYLENTVGDIAPLVDDILLASNEETTIVEWSKIDRLLLNKIHLAYQNNLFSVNLTENDLKDFKSDWDSLPPSISVMFRLLEGDSVYIENASGSSAANLLGRFSHGNSSINNIANEITAIEEFMDPDIVYAEIVHLPESRVGNILLHPAFRKYEIPFLAKSSVDINHQVKLQDLYISVKSGEIFLHSRILNKQIIPRLSTAHNFSFNALPVYQFLCDLQIQGKKNGIGFYWGSIASQFKFLPRVEYGKNILSPAQWNFQKTDIETLFCKEEDELQVVLSEFRKKWHLPQYIVLADVDNELFINLDDILMVKVWLDAIKKRHGFVLKEFFMHTEKSSVTDVKGNSFTNQLIAVLTKNGSSYFSLKKHENLIKRKEVDENFILGSEWLFYKLYCGTKTADKILSETIYPLVEHLGREKMVEEFFFIRYSDPSFHLRIRFHVTDVTKLGDVIRIVNRYFEQTKKDGYVWKIQTDEYRRELGRYGHNAIELVERLFYFDSLSVLQMLSLTEGDERENIRWIWALKAVDELLNAFGLSIEDKFLLLEKLKISFHVEFKSNKILKDKLNAKYRKYRKNVEDILGGHSELENDLYTIFEVLKQKNRNIQLIVSKLNKLNSENSLETPITELLFSLVHMLINRIVIAKPRLHELVIYDILFSFYKSVIEREK